MIKKTLSNITILIVSLLISVALMSATNDKFTAAEQQQISVPTPGLFTKSNIVNIDFTQLADKEYSFPLPVGKAITKGNELEIDTKKGDAVKAMFDGVVRLSTYVSGHGNVIVVRHHNGLETVYEHNAQNLVKVGSEVRAGQTIAIVGGESGREFLTFYIMINGAKINPETIISVASHKLRKQMLQCKKNGGKINLSVVDTDGGKSKKLMANLDEDPFKNNSTFKLDLQKIEEKHWSYPLPGAKVISPYGGRRGHSGVDLKTRPNDEIVAAFDGVVVSSGPFAGYGNCIRIKHAYGFETLYSHQSKNLVKTGQKVKAGEVIGLTGRTGRATTEHLHFEVSFRGHRFDPAIMFDHSGHKLKPVTLHLTKNKGVRSQKN